MMARGHVLLCGLISAALATAAHAAPGPAQETTRAQPEGALSGATIFVSPGHGWYFNDKSQAWITQRGITHGLIEDHSNGEAVLQYLLPYLWNAGAKVVTTRERDLQPNMVIVEAQPGTPGYLETGPWSDQHNVGARDGTQRVAETFDPASLKPANVSRVATAVFTPDIPEAGYYAVYAWYSAPADGTPASDAEFQIRHTGGTTVWRQDQSLDTDTWTYMGTYWFDQGASTSAGSVVLTNGTGKSGETLAIDAIRFGGGTGESGHPRWEESGRYHAEFMGYDTTRESRPWGTVGGLPMYCEWEADPAEAGRSVYIGWHTNANNGRSRGLFSFVYGPNSWGGLEEFTGFPGGVELVQTVHKSIINDVHAGYDPEWRDGPSVCRWLGETNPRYNNKMPAALFEMGFHDNAEDASYILDPQFRRIVARSVYQGIVDYYAEYMEGFDNAVHLPEPPTHLRVQSTDGKSVTLAWNPPPFDGGDGLLGDPAESYRVYSSPNGKGFDGGVPVQGTTFTIPDAPAGTTHYFRVAAANKGGESLPTETLAVRFFDSFKPRVLVVNGFDRLDRGLNLVMDRGLERGLLAKMNTFDYVIQHGEALAAAGFPFDSASNEAVRDGLVPLGGYDVVVWMLGQESAETSTFDAGERAAVAEYLDGGGALLVSGSEIGFDLALAAPEFLGSTLQSEYVETDSGTRTVEAHPDGAFAGLGSIAFGGMDKAVYPVKTPDVLRPLGAARASLVYAGGNKAAAIETAFPHRVIVMGFPFETIEKPADRNAVMKSAMRFLDTASDKRLTRVMPQ
ncbi:MAG: hypothetical protein PWP23_1343 [Candidatus Sumerlaeota bacterium]|nr:hypothetical protein [Candidatus Sumerlaeota bacterium]